jgi:hypothetical protein
MLLLILAGCIEFFAVQFANERVPEVSDAPDAVAARELFWDVFEQDQLDRLPEMIDTLTAASIAHPTDPSLYRLLGHAHFWWFVERERVAEALGGPEHAAMATDHAVMSEHYMEQAKALDPDDKRMHAWLGGSMLVVGGLRGDEVKQTRGYFETKRGIDDHPAFNLVTSGFIFSVPPVDSPAFPEAVNAMWGAIEQCQGGPIDRSTFDGSGIVGRDPKPPRAESETCWNKDRLYPYNQQGILFQTGELAMKAGDTALAKRLYEVTQSTPDYATWPRRHLLEDRLANLDAAAAAWDAKRADPEAPDPPFLLTSGHSCSVCHAVTEFSPPVVEALPEPEAVDPEP